MNISESAVSTKEYAEIFTTRGAMYHAAMQRCPRARDAEFAALFEGTSCPAQENILDVPSGGGYLTQALDHITPDHGCAVTPLEFSPGFSQHPRVVDPAQPWPLPPHAFDRLVCLASTHHLKDWSTLLSNMQQMLRVGGLLHLGDVPKGSGISTFLDDFVGRHTSTGHEGIYRDYSCCEWPDEFELVNVQLRPCPWRFERIEDCLQFCFGLFGLESSARDGLESALRRWVGLSETASGVVLHWELQFADLKRLA